MVPGDAKALALLDLGRRRMAGLPRHAEQRDHPRLSEQCRGRHQAPCASCCAARRAIPTAVGARITVEFEDGSTETSEVYAGSGYYSQSTAPASSATPPPTRPKRSASAGRRVPRRNKAPRQKRRPSPSGTPAANLTTGGRPIHRPPDYVSRGVRPARDAFHPRAPSFDAASSRPVAGGPAAGRRSGGRLVGQPLAPRPFPRGTTMFVSSRRSRPASYREQLQRSADAGGALPGIRTSSIGTGVAIGDYDGDGRPDIFVVSKTEGCRLFRNLGG